MKSTLLIDKHGYVTNVVQEFLEKDIVKVLNKNEKNIKFVCSCLSSDDFNIALLIGMPFEELINQININLIEGHSI